MLPTHEALVDLQALFADLLHFSFPNPLVIMNESESEHVVNEHIEYVRAEILKKIEETKALKERMRNRHLNPKKKLGYYQSQRALLRKESRALYLVYGFLRGRSLRSIERNSKCNYFNDIAWAMAKHLHLGVYPKKHDYSSWHRVRQMLYTTWLEKEDMSLVDRAMVLLERSKYFSRDELAVILKQVHSDVKELYYKHVKDSYYKPENKIGESITHTSPSCKYRLEISTYSTGSGTWKYTQGCVYDSQGTLLAEVRRNYHSFPFLFVEGHPNGDFLICGEDYQSPTVVDLTTKEAKTFKGDPFCWAEYKYHSETKTVLVSGCYWAAPYEYRFYDFSDPMGKGPTLLDAGEHSFNNDIRWPQINSDGTIVVSTSEEDVEENPPVVAITTFKREGLQLILTEEWVSEEEQERRRKAAIAEEKRLQFWKDFYAKDPLYLVHLECLKDKVFSPLETHSIGWTYEGWCPVKLEEERFIKRVVSTKNLKAEIEWAVLTGPVKVTVTYKDSSVESKLFMEHSPESVKTAYAYLKEVVREVSP